MNHSKIEFFDVPVFRNLEIAHSDSNMMTAHIRKCGLRIFGRQREIGHN